MATNRREFMEASAVLLAAAAAQQGRFAYAGQSDLQGTVALRAKVAALPA